MATGKSITIAQQFFGQELAFASNFHIAFCRQCVTANGFLTPQIFLNFGFF
jgi:hypothetical protein